MVLRKSYKFVLLFIAVFALNFLGGGLQATPERAGLSQENIAVILLIDTSGSMRSTDPQRLRETAARVFIDLLSPEDYLGLITFDHEANVVLPLQKVSSSANKELFKEKLSPQLEPRGNTDFTRALKAAAEQFRKTDAGGARPVAVLLTDGEPDPDPRRRSEALFMENYIQSLWETVATSPSRSKHSCRSYVPV
jgi:Mg-chelatase subunit ChlD